ncbi:ribosome biogenesis protein BRX1 homolog [Petromyzon marinus]|uniref:ribosome biogenesis protein BRX1 homolog n=1 Tax=Petromyzon marinus TaxID=7757 RepID=UPI003F6FACCE
MAAYRQRMRLQQESNSVGSKKRRRANVAGDDGGNDAKKAKKGKNAEKSQAEEDARKPTETVIPLPVSRGRWTNKERVLIFSSRGINYRTRHLMQDLRSIMPHSKPDTKMDRKDKLFVVNEICEMKNCNKCIYFEAKKKMDLYMWISNVPHGPSAKFLVQNVHTMAELKLTGNCLKGSRPLLSFDPTFDTVPHYAILKELFTQTFATPHYHPKSQPFVDHVLSFSIADHRIWIRNFQIVEEDGQLVEMGPRFVLQLIRLFQGSFGGPTLYENTHYLSPNTHRRQLRQQQTAALREKLKQKQQEQQQDGPRADLRALPEDPTEGVFVGPPAPARPAAGPHHDGDDGGGGRPRRPPAHDTSRPGHKKKGAKPLKRSRWAMEKRSRMGAAGTLRS